MAKRKRLTPARPGYLQGETPVLETKSGGLPGRAPIADMAGAAAATAALQELAGEIKEAESAGRFIRNLALDSVDIGYLVRDRIVADDEDLQSLIASIRARGQQTPIEVVQLEQGRYGLISGWRRLTALRHLFEETGARKYSEVLAILRRPESSAQAYVAMVEENEIRVGLSYYERARITARAVEQGVFETERYALLELFASASRARRSKIGSFLTVYHALDKALRFGPAIGERLGLDLARALSGDAGLAATVSDALQAEAPDSAEAEQAVLERVLKGQGVKSTPARRSEPDPAENRPMPQGRDQVGKGLTMTYSGRDLTLSGPAMSEALRRKLLDWLKRNS
jgi:ParB/RepB/Spo0J family partition protein